jgi:hypothetical protein
VKRLRRCNHAEIARWLIYSNLPTDLLRARIYKDSLAGGKPQSRCLAAGVALH